jgi:hypothetical protein
MSEAGSAPGPGDDAGRSGGVNLTSDQADIAGDVVGRDKVVNCPQP